MVEIALFVFRRSNNPQFKGWIQTYRLADANYEAINAFPVTNGRMVGYGGTVLATTSALSSNTFKVSYLACQ